MNPALVIGIGNPLLRDDGVGVRVAQQLAEHVRADVLTGALHGLALLDALEGYDCAVLVDATRSSTDRPGTIRRIELAELDHAPRLAASAHEMGVAQTLAWARRTGRRLPARLAIYTVAVQDAATMGDELSPPVRDAARQLVDRVLCEQFGAGSAAAPRKESA